MTSASASLFYPSLLRTYMPRPSFLKFLDRPNARTQNQHMKMTSGSIPVARLPAAPVLVFVWCACVLLCPSFSVLRTTSLEYTVITGCILRGVLAQFPARLVLLHKKVTRSSSPPFAFPLPRTRRNRAGGGKEGIGWEASDGASLTFELAGGR